MSSQRLAFIKAAKQEGMDQEKNRDTVNQFYPAGATSQVQPLDSCLTSTSGQQQAATQALYPASRDWWDACDDEPELVASDGEPEPAKPNARIVKRKTSQAVPTDGYTLECAQGDESQERKRFKYQWELVPDVRKAMECNTKRPSVDKQGTKDRPDESQFSLFS